MCNSNREANNSSVVKMIFQADKNTEIRMYRFPAHRFFPSVKLSCNVALIYVDIKVYIKEDGTYFTERNIAGSIPESLKLIQNLPQADVQLALQLPRSETADGKYLIADICEIVEAKDEERQTAYIYICDNGIRYVDSDLTKDEGSLTDCETVYRKAVP